MVTFINFISSLFATYYSVFTLIYTDGYSISVYRKLRMLLQHRCKE